MAGGGVVDRAGETDDRGSSGPWGWGTSIGGFAAGKQLTGAELPDLALARGLQKASW